MKLVLKNTKLVFAGIPAPTEKEFMKGTSDSNTGILVPNLYFGDGYSYETSFVLEAPTNVHVAGSIFGKTASQDVQFGVSSSSKTGGSTNINVKFGVDAITKRDIQVIGAVSFSATSGTQDCIIKATKTNVTTIVNGASPTSFEYNNPTTNVIYGLCDYRIMQYWGTDTEDGGTGADFAHFRYLKIFDANNDLANYFVPAVDYQGRPCLYDKVNNSCYYADNDSYISCYNS